jgi:flagellar basal-body rod protein FlgB
MDMTDVPLLSMLRQRMGWLGRRQDVLSENVANVDTPGYTARELKPIDFEKALRSVASSGVTGSAGKLTITNPMHMAMPQRNAGYQNYMVRDKETDQVGNSVSVEQEMIKVADTQAQFQAAANLYAKTLTMMKTAIGKSSGS